MHGLAAAARGGHSSARGAKRRSVVGVVVASGGQVSNQRGKWIPLPSLEHSAPCTCPVAVALCFVAVCPRRAATSTCSKQLKPAKTS